jgi:ATP-dependent Clp protease ATP-binding subunit ClpA
MVKDEIRTVLNLQDLLARRVLGQPHAIAEVVLARMEEGAAIERIDVGADGNGDFTYVVA